MELRFFFLLPVFVSNLFVGSPLHEVKPANPFVVYNTIWDNPLYAACNTGKHASYLSEREKDILFVLNLIRQYPGQFNETILATWPERQETPTLRQTTYYRSLAATLKNLSPKGLLTPDSLAWQSARCHALSSGKNSYTGHDRQSNLCTQQKYYHAECCHYGFSDPVEIVVSLLIDEDVPSLGHREICLDDVYKKLGVAFAPHKEYETNVVMDFLR